MGSLFKTSTPPAPPTPPASTYRDEVNKVEQVPVVQPDGSTVYVTRKIPLTAEEQARQDQLTGIMDEALAEMKKLSSSGYADDEATQKILADWEKMQKDYLATSQAQRAKSEEAELARRGLADSTVSEQVRRQRRLDAQDDVENLSAGKAELGSQIRQQKYGLQQQLYGIAAGATDATQARESAAATRSLSASVAQDQARQASILDYYGRQQTTAMSGNYGLFGKVLGGAVGGFMAGPQGAMVGSNIGSLLWRR